MMEVKVLLVDDEDELVQAVAERLELRGFAVGYVLSGEAAVKALEANPPDLMVLDLKMPGMDGMEVLRHVKRTRPDIEVIMLTGHGSEKDAETAWMLGVFDYLQKPVDIAVLVSVLKRAATLKV
jgi:two-component system, OmpR family, response regulator CpxR